MITEQANQRKSEASLTAIQRVAYFALPTLLIIGALIAYKSSAAVAVIGKVSATGSFTPRSNVIPLLGGAGASVLTRSLNYFLIIWPALAFGIEQFPGEDRVAMTVSLEVGHLDPLPTLLPVPSPAPPPHHSRDPVIDVVEGALARRVTVVHGPALDLLVQAQDHFPGRLAARAVDRFLDLGQERLDALG